MADGDGNKIHLHPMFLEGRNEVSVFGGLLGDLGVATEVPKETDFHDEDGARLRSEGGRVW